MSQGADYSVKLDWTLDGKTLKDSLNLVYPSKVEGPTKHIGNVEMNIIWFPNGNNSGNKGYPTLSVGIHSHFSLECKYMIYCPQLNIQLSYTYQFGRINKSCSWGKQVVKASTVKALQKISFRVTVEIKTVYDENNKVVPKHKWNEYLQLTETAVKLEPKLGNDMDIINTKVQSLSEMILQLQKEVTV
eukprot:550253_1